METCLHWLTSAYPLFTELELCENNLTERNLWREYTYFQVYGEVLRHYFIPRFL
jgi:hypothetical protein